MKARIDPNVSTPVLIKLYLHNINELNIVTVLTNTYTEEQRIKNRDRLLSAINDIEMELRDRGVKVPKLIILKEDL